MKQQIPNILSLYRFIAVFLVVACYIASAHFISPLYQWAAFFFLATGSFSDFLDGYLARRWQVVSLFGKIIDPIADKSLVCITLVILLYYNTIELYNLPIVAIIIIREFIVSALREVLAPRGITLPVSQVAKLKTALQFIALLCLGLGPLNMQGLLFDGAQVISLIGNILLLVAGLLTLISLYDYIVKAIQQMKAQSLS